MVKIITPVTVLALVIQSAPGIAQRTVYWDWALATTAQGCKTYIQYDRTTQTEASQLKRYRLSWTGSPCRKGQLINGVGTLWTNLADANIKTWEKGRMVNGVFDGPTKMKIIGSRDAVSELRYSMGCGVFDNGQPYGNCAPLPPRH